MENSVRLKLLLELKQARAKLTVLDVLDTLLQVKYVRPLVLLLLKLCVATMTNYSAHPMPVLNQARAKLTVLDVLVTQTMVLLVWQMKPRVLQTEENFVRLKLLLELKQARAKLTVLDVLDTLLQVKPVRPLVLLLLKLCCVATMTNYSAHPMPLIKQALAKLTVIRVLVSLLPVQLVKLTVVPQRA